MLWFISLYLLINSSCWITTKLNSEENKRRNFCPEMTCNYSTGIKTYISVIPYKVSCSASEYKIFCIQHQGKIWMKHSAVHINKWPFHLWSLKKIGYTFFYDIQWHNIFNQSWTASKLYGLKKYKKRKKFKCSMDLCCSNLAIVLIKVKGKIKKTKQRTQMILFKITEHNIDIWRWLQKTINIVT